MSICIYIYKYIAVCVCERVCFVQPAVCAELLKRIVQVMLMTSHNFFSTDVFSLTGKQFNRYDYASNFIRLYTVLRLRVCVYVCCSRGLLETKREVMFVLKFAEIRVSLCSPSTCEYRVRVLHALQTADAKIPSPVKRRNNLLQPRGY